MGRIKSQIFGQKNKLGYKTIFEFENDNMDKKKHQIIIFDVLVKVKMTVF